MIYYEVSLDTPLDPGSVNSDSLTINYLAWMIGIDLSRKKGLWLIESVRTGFDTPESVISGDYTKGVLTDDVDRYGYSRVVSPKLKIEEVLTNFTNTVNTYKTAIDSI